METKIIPSIRKRIQGLDELRGIAALAVLIVHANFIFPEIVCSNAGPIAVDVFLIISGFLIGKILLKSKGEEFFFRRFYIRRIFRIAPLSWAAIVGGILLSLVLKRSLQSVPYYLLFVQNFIPVDLVNPVGSAGWIGPLPGCSPMWSLAVEEHFYLLLPMCVYFIPVKKLPQILLSIMIGCIVLKVVGTQHYYSWYSNPHETWMRIPYLLMGVILNFDGWKKYLSIFFAAWIVCVALFKFPLVSVEIPVAALMLGFVYGAISGKFVLKNRFLAFSGKICFGLYVIHYFVRALLDNVGLDFSSSVMKFCVFAFYLLVSYALAVISFYFFEMPIQNFRGRFEGASTSDAAKEILGGK